MNYHFTENRQRWLQDNKQKLRIYMREYMRKKRYSSKGDKMKIEYKKIILYFN
tara:strand:- start:660 stop:818 length:159 start_codon:yes stop_codon:yes gene_type:complete